MNDGDELEKKVIKAINELDEFYDHSDIIFYCTYMIDEKLDVCDAIMYLKKEVIKDYRKNEVIPDITDYINAYEKLKK